MQFANDTKETGKPVKVFTFVIPTNAKDARVRVRKPGQELSVHGSEDGVTWRSLGKVPGTSYAKGFDMDLLTVANHIKAEVSAVKGAKFAFGRGNRVMTDGTNRDVLVCKVELNGATFYYSASHKYADAKAIDAIVKEVSK